MADIGDKYIIEIADKYNKETYNGDIITLYTIKGSNGLVFNESALNDFIPADETSLCYFSKADLDDAYTQGVTDQIKKTEGYSQRIYDDGFHVGYDLAINDLMDAFKIIQKMSKAECFQTFGIEHGENVIDNFNGKEILDKIAEYKFNKHQIHIGDELDIGCDDIIIVTNIHDDMICEGIDSEGKAIYVNGKIATKTGRHFDSIESLINFLKIKPHEPDNYDCCDNCKYAKLDEDELPCSMCCYNYSEDGISYYTKGECE